MYRRGFLSIRLLLRLCGRAEAVVIGKGVQKESKRLKELSIN